MKLVWQCLFSPRLLKVYEDGSRDMLYQPHVLEKFGDKIITLATTIMNIGFYTSPFICTYVVKRGFFSIDEMRFGGRIIGSIGCLLAISFMLRAYGRACSPKYVQFLRALRSPTSDKKEYINKIREFDFEFYAWPYSYKLPVMEKPWSFKHPFSSTANADLPVYKRGPIQLLAFIATHTFGLRLIYPGSLAIIHHLLFTLTFEGRTQLVEGHKGQRSKLGTADGNDIDTMFVDNRSNNSTNGNILVVCCEGNSGFYEIGIMMTPVKAGYSALGWNHPGFAGSTGLPYPSQEHRAIDVVMLYAINELGFLPENIVLFGWSIGGYPATWAAVNYGVRGLILDATFDDVLPLAERQMPTSWKLLVKEVIRTYVDLNVSKLLSEYNGPVHIVRRTEDEIMNLIQDELTSNRGNNIVMDLFRYRHPEIKEEPAGISTLCKLVTMRVSQRDDFERYMATSAEKKLLKLISRYMTDFRSTHCTPLPEEHFQSIMNKLDDMMD